MAQTDVTSEARKARNEATFRDANESVRSVQRDLHISEGPMPFICECEDPACRTVIRVTQAEYERVRADAVHFLIATGHPATGGNVIEEHESYSVVEKTGISAEIAAETDPRRET